MSDIHERIKTRREICKKTQRQLANELNVTTTTVSSWETKRNKPWESLQELSSALGVSIDWLVTGKEFKASSEPAPAAAKAKTTPRPAAAKASGTKATKRGKSAK